MIIAFGYYVSKMNPILSFWFAYISPRPLGASFGDLFSQPLEHRGLGFGTVVTSHVFLAGIAVITVYLTLTIATKMDQENWSARGEGRMPFEIASAISDSSEEQPECVVLVA